MWVCGGVGRFTWKVVWGSNDKICKSLGELKSPKQIFVVVFSILERKHSSSARRNAAPLGIQAGAGPVLLPVQGKQGPQGVFERLQTLCWSKLPPSWLAMSRNILVWCTSWGAITMNPTRVLWHLEFIGLCFLHTRLVSAQKPEHQAGQSPQIPPLPFQYTLRSNAPAISPPGPKESSASRCLPSTPGWGGNRGHETRFPVQSCSGNSLSLTVPLPYRS